MRALVQRVQSASVAVDGEVVGAIEQGLCVLVGATHSDTDVTARRLAEKVWHLRCFDGVDGRPMDAAVAAVGGAVLVVSQFTLYGDTSRGRRPSWTAAAPPAQAEPLIRAFSAALEARGAHVQTGRFGADMQVTLQNDGPVTLLLEVEETSPGFPR